MPKRPFVVLLIDDDYCDAVLFSELALDISPDIQVHHTFNGREALDYLNRGFTGDLGAPRPDLMVLDVNMPVMDGHAFLEEARCQHRFQPISIIVLSLSGRPQDIRRPDRNHASGHLVKPEAFDDMKELVRVVTSYWSGAVTLPTLADLGGEPGVGRL